MASQFCITWVRLVNIMSQKPISIGSLSYMEVLRHPLVSEIQSLTIDFLILQKTSKGRILAHVDVRSKFFGQIKSRKFEHKNLSNLREKVFLGEAREVVLNDEGMLRIHGHLCVPRVDNIVSTILVETHNSNYCILSRLAQHYGQRRMKCHIVDFVTKCQNYQQVKY